MTTAEALIAVPGETSPGDRALGVQGNLAVLVAGGPRRRCDGLLTSRGAVIPANLSQPRPGSNTASTRRSAMSATPIRYSPVRRCAARDRDPHGCPGPGASVIRRSGGNDIDERNGRRQCARSRSSNPIGARHRLGRQRQVLRESRRWPRLRGDGSHGRIRPLQRKQGRRRSRHECSPPIFLRRGWHTASRKRSSRKRSRCWGRVARSDRSRCCSSDRRW